jgi:hypothetical protein
VVNAHHPDIGVRTLGDGRGCKDSTLHLGRLVDNRIGLDARRATDTTWNNAIRYLGGHFADSSGVNACSDRFGMRLSAEPDATSATTTTSSRGRASSSPRPARTWRSRS